MLFDKHENIKIPHLLHCPRPIFGQSDSLCNWVRVLFMKPVFNFTHYSISIEGIVYNKKMNPMKPYLDKRGYYRIHLRDMQGKRHIRYLHQLLALAFLPNPLNKCCINHINGIKTDNRLENLEWCTLQENLKHAVETGLRIPGNQVQYHQKQFKLNFEKAQEIRELRKEGVPVTELQKRYGVGNAIIYLVLNNKKWTKPLPHKPQG